MISIKTLAAAMLTLGLATAMARTVVAHVPDPHRPHPNPTTETPFSPKEFWDKQQDKGR